MTCAHASPQDQQGSLCSEDPQGPGCGLRRQVPCRRRLHNPQRPQGGRTTECVRERVARCVCLGVGCGGKYHVDGVYKSLSVRNGRQLLASLTFSCAGVGHAAKRGVAKAPRPAARTRVGQWAKRALMLSASKPQNCAGHAAKRGFAKAPRPAAQTRVGQARVDVVCKQAAELRVSGAALAWG